MSAPEQQPTVSLPPSAAPGVRQPSSRIAPLLDEQRQRWPALVAAWLEAVAIAAGDLAWSYLVLPPGLDMLQRRIFGLVHSGVEEQVASLSLVMIAASAVLALLVLRISRVGPARARGRRPTGD